MGRERREEREGRWREAGFDLLLALQGEDGGRERRKPTSGEGTVNHRERWEGVHSEGAEGGWAEEWGVGGTTGYTSSPRLT